MVVTELAVFSFGPGGLQLIETAPGVTVDEVRARTEATFEEAIAVAPMLV
jgi:acyl CoA:acetate/3-ketoacid CoA transferase beta subunit